MNFFASCNNVLLIIYLHYYFGVETSRLINRTSADLITCSARKGSHLCVGRCCSSLASLWQWRLLLSYLPVAEAEGLEPPVDSRPSLVFKTSSLAIRIRFHINGGFSFRTSPSQPVVKPPNPNQSSTSVRMLTPSLASTLHQHTCY